MRLDLYEFEAAEAVSEDGGTDVSGEAEAVSPDVSGAAEASPEAEAASPQASPTAEIDWEQALQRPEVQDYLQQMTNTQVQHMIEQMNGQEEVSRPDPFADDFDSQLERYVQSKLDERFGQIEPVVNDYQNERGERQIAEQIAGLKGHIEGFDPDKHGESAKLLAQGFIGDEVQRYGETPQAASAAIRRGAEHVSRLVSAERKAAVEEYKEWAKGGGDKDAATPYEPGVRGAALSMEDAPRDELEVVARRFAQQPL